MCPSASRSPISPITVVVADPQPLFAEALGIALQRCPSLDVVDQHPETAAELLRLVELQRPQVVVTSYWLRDMEGPEVVRGILMRAPDAKVIQLSWLYGPLPVRDSLNAGAVGFLPKSISVDTLVEGIVRAKAGESLIFGDEIDRLLADDHERGGNLDLPGRLAALTPRELEILRLLATGLTAQEIAHRLDIAKGTVRTHVHKVLCKLGARSQLEVVAIARDHGVVM